MSNRAPCFLHGAGSCGRNRLAVGGAEGEPVIEVGPRATATYMDTVMPLLCLFGGASGAWMRIQASVRRYT